VTRPITRVIRLRVIRHRIACKYLWRYLTDHYDLTVPQVIKVRPTALELGLKPRTMRRALALLVQHRYLDVVVKPTEGTPGEYLAGPRAYRLPPATVPVPKTRRGHKGPRPHPDQLALEIPTREGVGYAA
jgi:hypothetical protein